MFYYFLRELVETGYYGGSEGVLYTLLFLAAVGKAPRRKHKLKKRRLSNAHHIDSGIWP